MPEDPLIEFANATLRIARKLRSYPISNQEITTITPLECMVLLHVQRSPGCSPTDITRELRLRSSNTSNAIRNLVKKDQIVRKPDPDDRRSAQLFITDYAVRSLDTLNDIWRRNLAESGLYADQWTALCEMVNTIDNSLHEAPLGG